ncbi:FLX-like protein 3 [Tanacetum coccineum]
MHADKDARARDLTERGIKLEVELQKTEPLRTDASYLRDEGQKLNSLRQLLSNQLQTLTKDTNILRVENEQVVAIKTDIDGKEAMENNLILIAHEIEKLQGEQMRTRGLGRGCLLIRYGASQEIGPEILFGQFLKRCL